LKGGRPRKLLLQLFCDYAAGDSIAGVSRRIGFHVIRFRVDDDRSSPVAEQRVSAVAERYVFILQRRVGFALYVNRKVLHIAGVMPIGILKTMLLAFRIEMRASRFEIRGIALGILMKVNGVLAGRKVVKMQFKADARSLCRQDNGANGFALGVLEFDFGFGRAGKSCHYQNDGESNERQSERFHAGIIKLPVASSYWNQATP